MKFQNLLLGTGAALLAFNMTAANVFAADLNDKQVMKDSIIDSASFYFNFAKANSAEPHYVFTGLDGAETILKKLNKGNENAPVAWELIGTTSETVKAMRAFNHMMEARRAFPSGESRCNFLEAAEYHLKEAANAQGGSVIWEVVGMSEKDAMALKEKNCPKPSSSPATAAERKRAVLEALKGNLSPGIEITID